MPPLILAPKPSLQVMQQKPAREWTADECLLIAPFLKDQTWRLNNLYTVIDEDGLAVPFRMRPVQKFLFENRRYRNILCKARQLGMTTFVDLLGFDMAAWTSNFRAGIIAHTMPAAQAIFQDKIRFVYDQLPPWIKNRVKTEKNEAGEIRFKHNSSLRVATSFRSATTRFLHVSELARISVTQPARAREIITGSLPTVHQKGHIFIESTAEGPQGVYYDLVQQAMKNDSENVKMSDLHFQLFFEPWYRHAPYAVPRGDVTMTGRMKEYFGDLKDKTGVKFTPEQMAWYVATESVLGANMLQQHPSTIEEAFRSAIEGAYYKQQMYAAYREGRICAVPYDKRYPVDTAWDIGHRDSTAIWFIQQIQGEHRIIDYLEHSGEGLGYYSKELDKKKYKYRHFYAPADIAVHEWGSGKTRLETALMDFGIPFTTGPVVSLDDGIEQVRKLLPKCRFDESNCTREHAKQPVGIPSLESYQHEWDSDNGVWKTSPLHNWACMTSNTHIRTLNGWREIGTLVGTQPWVWCYSIVEHRIVPAQAQRVWKSADCAEVVEVMLDNGATIRCTADHKFMLRAEGWKPAWALAPGDSLMPFYERIDSGYIHIHLNDGSLAPEHKYVYARCIGPLQRGKIIHHEDGSKHNNEPSNLAMISIAEHISAHASEPERLAKLARNAYCNHPAARPKDNSAKKTVVKRRPGWNHDPANWTREMRAQTGADSIRSWKASETLRPCRECGGTMRANWKRLYCCANCNAKANSHRRRTKPVEKWTHRDDCTLVESSPRNHKVVTVSRLRSREAVYDMHVPRYNNFVAEGVVVHNSHGASALATYALCVSGIETASSTTTDDLAGAAMETRR